MNRNMKIVCMTMLLVTALYSQVSANEEIIYHKQEKGSVSLGVEVNSGKYGTSDTTTGVYMPLIATWFPNSRIDVGVEIPFVYQSTSYTTTVSGVSVPVTTVTRGRGGRTSYTTTSTPSSTGSTDLSASGIGDLIFRFGVIALIENGKLPQIRPSVYIKAPTASTSDGLGTGELDAGVGVEASKWIGDTRLTGEVFYNYLGKVPALSLKDYFSYTAGAGYQVTEILQPMLLVKGSTQTSSGSDGQLELRARLLCTLTKATTLDAFISKGISKYSPDYGGGIAVIYSF